MHRRTMLALAAAIPLAGCGDTLGGVIGGDTLIDATLSTGNTHEFSGSEGDELSITVTVHEAEAEDDDEDADQDVESVSFTVAPAGEPAVVAESIEEGAEFTTEVTLEQDATYVVNVVNGEADVLIEHA